jgi:dihydrofolate synthase/folylpolyglutamate synthase
LFVEPTSVRYEPWTVASANGDGVRVETTRYVFPEVKLGLRGKHQIENAETAVRVMQCLRYDCGLDFDDGDIIAGLESARHPGRLEFKGRYLFDGAHNIGGAKALRLFLDEEVNKPITMIFGAMKDKDVEAVAKILFPAATKLILTQPENERAIEVSKLQAIANATAKHSKIIVTSSAAEAIAKAETISEEDSIILVTGSLYLVGEVQKLLEQRS